MARKKRRSGCASALILLLMLFLLMVVGIGGWLFLRYTPTREKMSGEVYFGLEKPEDMGLVINGEKQASFGKLLEGRAYLDIETVKMINDKFYWDASKNTLLMTTPETIVEIDLSAMGYNIGDTTENLEHILVKQVDGKTYVSLELVEKNTQMDSKVYTNPNHIHIENLDVPRMAKLGKITKHTPVRYQGGIKSPIIDEVYNLDEVEIKRDFDDWLEIVTPNGFIGYVPTKYVAHIEEREMNSRPHNKEEIEARDKIINLVWHQVTNVHANDGFLDAISQTKGVNVISPTWFSLSDNEGTITSIASQDYVNQAHEKGMKVWGLVDNFTYPISTYEILSSAEKRAKVIEQLVAYAEEFNLDGINIDFEQLTEAEGEPFVQFMRELSLVMKEKQITLSVDVPVVSIYTSHYNRRALGEVVDYLIIMGYDEHYPGGDLGAGSVASLPFVKSGIEETLNEGVPASKVINGLPFYTRVWFVGDDGSVSSEAVGMQTAQNFVEKSGKSPVWLETESQYYLEVPVEGGVRKVWLEEEASLKAKLEVMKENNLAGVAAWKLGFEEPKIWDLISQYY